MTHLEILFLIGLFSVFAGDLLAVVLPLRHKGWDMKPFNCRPCLTFHLVWLSAVPASLFADSIPMAFWGLVEAFIIFGIVKYIDNKKIEL